ATGRRSRGAVETRTVRTSGKRRRESDAGGCDRARELKTTIAHSFVSRRSSPRIGWTLRTIWVRLPSHTIRSFLVPSQLAPYSFDAGARFRPAATRLVG